MAAGNNGKVKQPLKKAKPRKRRNATTRNEIILSTAQDYSSQSTIHGLQYVGDRQQSKRCRFFWTIIVVLALACTSYQLFQICSQWFEDPVVTSLDTISLPVEKIDFPAVTMCPQGSTADIMDNFFFHQFEEWLVQNVEDDGTINKRKKREEESTICECRISGNITNDDLQCCFQHFLNETYPGVYPNNPSKIATMLHADDPVRTITTKAVILPDEEPKCDESDSLEILKSVNQKMNRVCPEPSKNFDDLTCIIGVSSEIQYTKAETFCKGHGGANIFFLGAFEDISALDKILSK